VLDDDPAVPLDKLRGLAGLWQLLIVRSKLRARMEIERERNRAYADHRDRLPRGAELADHESSQGRGFWIRVADAGEDRAVPLSAPAMIELGPAAITESRDDAPGTGW
jgi:hypothetical protein